MEEKVKYFRLPEGAEYRKTIRTEAGTIGIVYNSPKTVRRKNKVIIPKPKALVGGTEVYQKDGIPYWYCKIKNGRDEFMHIPMEDLTEEDLPSKDILINNTCGGERNVLGEFKAHVLEALADKPQEGRWVPVYEPSYNRGNHEIQFIAGVEPFAGMDPETWEDILNKYSPENESGMCSKNTYFLLLLRWLKDGYTCLEEILINSADIGNYFATYGSKNYEFEFTGERMFGGLYGFAGNTYKYIKESKNRHIIMGGCYDDNFYPVGVLPIINNPHNFCSKAVGLLELKK